MALNFPNTPTINQVYSYGADSWTWSGIAWELVPDSSPTFTALTVTDVIIGRVSDISNHQIDDLSDVDLSTTPQNNNVLAYSTALQSWRPLTLTSTFTGGEIPDALIIADTTGSTSVESGALQVVGGIGVAENIYIGGDLRFPENNGDNYVGFKSPDSLTGSQVYALPPEDGELGQFLSTDGTGNLAWTTAPGAAGATPPAGSNEQVQFNNNGIFGGNINLKFNIGTSTLTTSNVLIQDTTNSTTISTGALRVSGGIGVAGQLTVGGATNKFIGNTNSVDITTGTVVITGGLGVSNAINVGSTITATTAPTDVGHLTNKQYVDATISAFSIAFGV